MVREAVPLKGTVRFASSGTEIDQLVIRLARGFTGRPKFLKFEGHYHGWADSVNYSVHPPLGPGRTGGTRPRPWESPTAWTRRPARTW